ncbi:hypothetical protein XM38_050660 [Halomicronema hongdechloris C2206]|uniref:Uncharacterized protein n=1 Tax=Halomicronema hongdechloris C2206 TaxID=1641165 RepID=A0A1Z3HUZ3_9CYAN|nr:hypothetical protein XM38_050660 [Halomicronema hongdechloris C2206]
MALGHKQAMLPIPYTQATNSIPPWCLPYALRAGYAFHVAWRNDCSSGQA